MTTLPSSEKLARIIFDVESKHEARTESFDRIKDQERVNRLSMASDILAVLYKMQNGKK